MRKARRDQRMQGRQTTAVCRVLRPLLTLVCQTNSSLTGFQMSVSNLQSEIDRLERMLAADQSGERPLRFDEIALLLQRLEHLRKAITAAQLDASQG